MTPRRSAGRRHPGPRRPQQTRPASDGPTARLFIAVQPPGPVLAELGGVVDQLAAVRSGARATDRALWHITVAFLGDVPEEQIPAASDALAAAAERAGPLQLRIAGGGRFGRGAFTVLWAGVAGQTSEDLSAFGGLARVVRRELRRARLPYDDKPFRPHLTLARPGGKLTDTAVQADVAMLHDYQGTVFAVEDVWLFRSHLGPHPTHEPVSRHLL